MSYAGCRSAIRPRLRLYCYAAMHKSDIVLLLYVFVRSSRSNNGQLTFVSRSIHYSEGQVTCIIFQ